MYCTSVLDKKRVIYIEKSENQFKSTESLENNFNLWVFRKVSGRTIVMNVST